MNAVGIDVSKGKSTVTIRSPGDIVLMPPCDIHKAVSMLNTASETVESLHRKMNETASTLPEYPVVMAMNGVGPTLGPQLMAEIGDVTRFTYRGALTAFAGVDPGKNDSGSTFRKVCAHRRKAHPAFAGPSFRSWMVSSSVLLLMTMFMLLWTRSGHKASLTMST